MSTWFGKSCKHQACQWEDNERTGGPDYQECTPVLIICGHDDNPEDTEGNCREKICPLGLTHFANLDKRTGFVTKEIEEPREVVLLRRLYLELKKMPEYMHPNGTTCGRADYTQYWVPIRVTMDAIKKEHAKGQGGDGPDLSSYQAWPP